MWFYVWSIAGIALSLFFDIIGQTTESILVENLVLLGLVVRVGGDVPGQSKINEILDRWDREYQEALDECEKKESNGKRTGCP